MGLQLAEICWQIIFMLLLKYERNTKYVWKNEENILDKNRTMV